MTIDINALRDTMFRFKVGDRVRSLLHIRRVGVIRERHFVRHDPTKGGFVEAMYMVHFPDADSVLEHECTPLYERHLLPTPSPVSSAPLW